MSEQCEIRRLPGWRGGPGPTGTEPEKKPQQRRRAAPAEQPQSSVALVGLERARPAARPEPTPAAHRLRAPPRAKRRRRAPPSERADRAQARTAQQPAAQV